MLCNYLVNSNDLGEGRARLVAGFAANVLRVPLYPLVK
jgi:hypothetical protein